jgi:hypothetical protein
VAQPSGGFVVFTTGNLGFGRRLWRSFTLPSRSDGVRVLAYMTLAKMEVMQGRWEAAKAELDAGASLDPGIALEHRALLSFWPMLDVPRSELVELRDALLRWKPVTGQPDQTGSSPPMFRPIPI